jgi:serine/threonine protein kinase
MNRWEQIESIYQSALERDEDQRVAFVEAASSGDEELRREVESLLVSNISAQDFMRKSALQATARRLATDRAPSLLVGRQFGAYQIVSLIGAGGMGTVYRATDTRLNRSVAIKVLHSHLSMHPVWRQRFEREARAISHLSHPHICTLHDVGQEDDSDFLVMEYLEGETLAQRLKKGPLPVEQVLRYAIEIASALDQAHRQGVIHRDLKPGNVMLTRAGAKLLDFGLAKQQVLSSLTRGTTGSQATGQAARSQDLPSETDSITEEGVILGTLRYMAPEQVEGKEADTRTDIFALGVVIYEMATGRKAFEGESKASLAAAILTSQPPPMTTIEPLTPLALQRGVQRCLAKDPEERWQSARDLVIELKWIAEGQSSEAIPVAAKVQRGQRIWWAVLAALSLLFVSLGAFIGRNYFRRSPPAPSTTRFTIPPQNSKAFPIPFISPDGQKVAIYEGSTLWIRPLNSVKAYSLGTIKNVEASTGDLFWSGDSRFVAFWEAVDNRARLKRIEITGGTPRTICETVIPASVNDQPAGGFGHGTWSRQGVILFVRGDQGGGISRVSADGGTPVKVTTLDPARGETDHILPRFLPDGRNFLYAVFSRKPGYSGIYLGSLDSPGSKLLIDSPSSSPLDKYFVYAPSGHLLYKRQGQLLARPFDAKSLRFTGESVPLEDQPARWGDPSVSENGTLCYNVWASDPITRIAKFDRTGKEVDTIGSPGGYSDLDLSPDGARLAVEETIWNKPHADIWIFDVGRGTKTQVTISEPAAFYFCPRWSPEGNQVLFSSSEAEAPDSNDGNLYLKAASGEGSKTALLKSSGPKHLQDWSRDGRYVLYGSAPGIWALPLFGERKPFVFLQSAYQGRFSSDGRWVAYVDEPPSGNPEDRAKINVYVRAFPSGEGKRRISANGGRAPRWRADGKELYYWAEDRKLVSVKIEPGKDFHFGPPKILFESIDIDPHSEDSRQRYAVSPDGQYFYMLVDESPPIAYTRIVLNWTADLPAR